MTDRRKNTFQSWFNLNPSRTQRRAGDTDDSGIRMRKIRPQINLNTILLVILIIVCGIFFSLSDAVSLHKTDCSSQAKSN